MQEQPPQPARQISGRTLVVNESFECPICQDVIVDPVTTECHHTFCRHCISTCFGHANIHRFVDGQLPTVLCPRCRADIAVHYEVNSKIVDAMRQAGLLRSQQVGGHAGGKAATINSHDGNRTESETFDLVLNRENAKDNSASTLAADIVWGRGTVHSTYRETTCRVEGTVGSDDRLTARASYSNGPWEEWTGRLMRQPDGRSFDLTDGKYIWHGWNNRTSNGALELTFAVTAGTG